MVKIKRNWGFLFFMGILVALFLAFCTGNKQMGVPTKPANELSLEQHLDMDKKECEKFNNRLFDGKEVVVNAKNDTILFSDLVKDLSKPILIIRFSSYACSSCVDYLLQKTIPLAKNNKMGTNLLIIDNVVVGDLHVMQNEYEDFIFYKSDSLFTDFDMALTPYMFFIDKDEKIQDFYIPRKEVPDSVDTFFEYINNKYIKCRK